MNILAQLQERFRAALAGFDGTDALLEMVRPSQDPKFGDYQANFAMALGKQLGRPPREVAAEVVARLTIDDLCEPAKVEGPGFINLRLKDTWIIAQLQQALVDERLAVERVAEPRTYVVDYSAPNVAKPMHVGHIRSTVIGDALCRTLRFLGHRVTSDNHLGDWGTQFGMIIYGYKHFLDAGAYQARPVEELSRLYRLVNRLVDYHEARTGLPDAETEVKRLAGALADAQAAPPGPAEKKAADKGAAKALRRLETQQRDAQAEVANLQRKIADVENDVSLSALARAHENIAQAVLAETARLHAGDPESRRLWEEFLPPARQAIEGIYQRLGVRFDVTLGESFYHDQLASAVAELEGRGIAGISDGAVCIFIEGHEAPMLIRKQDGAFLYATTDLATIRYRMERWKPAAILYIVDHRQSLHFVQLFAAARLWGYRDVELEHVSFGTVLGEDGRPFKTRSGETVGLESLLDEAVRRASEIVASKDDAKAEGPELSDKERRRIAEVVGVGALKYADLSQNRTSDYVFSYDKMLAMDGNTSTYMQFAYARVLSIFRKGGVRPESVRRERAAIELSHPAERALGLAILQFAEALDQVTVDYRPNFLTSYLFELANRYSTFFEQCPVLRAESDAARESRLILCDLTARTIRRGLDLLGIGVVEKM